MEEEKTTISDVKKEEPTKKVADPNHSLSVITLLVALGSLGFGIYNFYNSSSVTNYNYGPDGNSMNFVAGSIADIANKVSSSVVSITTEVRTKSWIGEQTGQAAGTGFIISEKGYIMTNKHVVKDAKKINVTLSDGTRYKDVEVVGLDPLNDSAILKVKDPKDFKAVTLGDSKTITVGQEVIVIGNALGEYSNSVTSGIVSGTGRSLIAGDSNGSNRETLSDMIQTDAAINGGNSGGPIVNAAGEVIGIATAYASDSNTVGFAIPIANVRGIIKNVIENGKFARAVLGVTYVSIDPEVQEQYKLPVNYGAYISSENSAQSSVISGGAAADAGLKDGDIITEINGIKIGRAGSLGTLIGEYKVGDEITVKVIRKSQTFDTKVKLKAYND